ncbi:MAG TPA: hypothetical protein VIW29_07095, partial [Polyangiaceae bacterium]
GMEHSNQVREFVITRQGVSLVEPYVGPAGVLTGTARVTQEAAEATAERERAAEQRRAQRLLEQKRTLFERRISELRAELNAEEAELQASIKSAADSQEERLASRARMTSKRAGGVTTIDKASRGRGSRR